MSKSRGLQISHDLLYIYGRTLSYFHISAASFFAMQHHIASYLPHSERLKKSYFHVYAKFLHIYADCQSAWSFVVIK